MLNKSKPCLEFLYDLPSIKQDRKILSASALLPALLPNSSEIPILLLCSHEVKGKLFVRFGLGKVGKVLICQIAKGNFPSAIPLQP